MEPGLCSTCKGDTVTVPQPEGQAKRLEDRTVRSIAEGSTTLLDTEIMQMMAQEIEDHRRTAQEAVPVAWAYYWPDGGLMDVLTTAVSPYETLRQVPLYAHATPTAQEAVPVGWITQPYPGVKWSFSFHEPNTLPEGWIARPLYAHPPQPSETVAVLEEARSGLCAFAGGPSGACSETIKRIDAALRALKGDGE